jgi:hypothetical protein
MTRHSITLALGSWVLIGGAALAAQPVAPERAARGIWLVADSDFSATKDKYVDQARDQMADWKRKLDDAGDKVGAQARTSSDAAERDLHTAWRKTQAAADRLQGASQDGWDRVKSSFERASRDLKETWNRVHPDAK